MRNSRASCSASSTAGASACVRSISAACSAINGAIARAPAMQSLPMTSLPITSLPCVNEARSSIRAFHLPGIVAHRRGWSMARAADTPMAIAPELCDNRTSHTVSISLEDAMGEFAMGQSVPRFEDPRLVKGGGRYVGDMVLPGMAFGYVLRSPHAHARIRSIDTTKAKAAPGVLAVLTGADWQASGWGDLPVPGGLTRRDGSVFKPPYPALTKDTVRFVGDYVAFVVAETLHQAMDAAELVAIDYELLPTIASTAQAMSPGAAKVWDGSPDNIGFVQLFGDKAAADAAFAKADHVVKHRFVINRVTAASMEPRGALADYNATEDRYTIYTTLQRVHPYRSELSQVLKVPESKIRVVAGDIGGSFGMKSAVYNEVALVLLASKALRRPVKWISTRSESFLCDAQARDNVTEAELALDKQGRFLAMRAKVVAAIGAYLQTGMQAFTGNIGTLAGVYRIPAMHADVTAVFTHTNPVRPYRGNGRPEAAYVIERLVDLAADELNFDPSELRRRNYIA